VSVTQLVRVAGGVDFIRIAFTLLLCHRTLVLHILIISIRLSKNLQVHRILRRTAFRVEGKVSARMNAN
jgi:hypothetical protein